MSELLGWPNESFCVDPEFVLARWGSVTVLGTKVALFSSILLGVLFLCMCNVSFYAWHAITAVLG